MPEAIIHIDIKEEDFTALMKQEVENIDPKCIQQIIIEAMLYWMKEKPEWFIQSNNWHNASSPSDITLTLFQSVSKEKWAKPIVEEFIKVFIDNVPEVLEKVFREVFLKSFMNSAAVSEIMYYLNSQKG